MDSIGDICRICLTIGANISIFSTNNENEQISEKLTYCIGINICATEDLPKMLCQQCCDHLDSSYKFKQRALAIDSYLRSKFSAIKEELALVRSDCSEPYPYLTYPANEALSVPPPLEFPYELAETGSIPKHIENEHKLEDIKKKLKLRIGFKKQTYTGAESFCDSGEFCNNTNGPKISQIDKVGDPNTRKSKAIQNTYECDICNSTFSNIKKLIKHMKLDHNKNLHRKSKKHMCDTCGKIFHDNHGLLKHKLSHSGVKPFVCQICATGFSQHANMERHLLAKHAEDKHFQCELCPSKFAYKSTLKEHQRCFHGGERRYTCATCEKRFTKRFSLKRHTLTHTNTRSYLCHYCDKAYAQSYDLKLHIRRMHPQDTN